LLKDAPEHIVIETFLVLFIIWLMFIRRTVDPNKASKNQKLSKQEEQWLMDTWEPEPLGFAPATEKEGVLHDSIMVGLHTVHCRLSTADCPLGTVH